MELESLGAGRAWAGSEGRPEARDRGSRAALRSLTSSVPAPWGPSPGREIIIPRHGHVAHSENRHGQSTGKGRDRILEAVTALEADANHRPSLRTGSTHGISEALAPRGTLHMTRGGLGGSRALLE